MADWVGFTDADLEQMKSDASQKRVKQPRPEKKPVQRRTSKPGSGNKRPGPKEKQEPTLKPSDSSNLSGAFLSKTSKDLTESSNDQHLKDEEVKKSTHEANEQKTPTSISEKNILIDDEEIREKEKLKLEDVHLRQKQMEEKNRKKKALLAKEIAERKKKAFAESHKLIKIQEEFGKLDQMLNIDVSILRDKIEEACLEFAHAQKRFNKAEAEYVEAKMDLHKKTMRKEDLTEHLYHMIQANEERKAKKLEELMSKLDVEESVEEEVEKVETQSKDAAAVTENPSTTPSSDEKPNQTGIESPIAENSLHGENA